VLFHYSLVDDLIGKEEFEQRVERKIDECGDLIDEPAAAMMIVSELGRAHVKIQGLSAKSSLFSFFGKVIDKTEPKIFDRADGEKGAVATLLLGDETGTVRIVLWDERAGIADEVVPGDVLEIIGRHPGTSTQEIYALAVRKAGCMIECHIPPGSMASLKQEPVELDVVLLNVREQKTYTRRDGTKGELRDALAGDAEGTARIVSWIPDLIGSFPAGSVVHITGAKPNIRGDGRSFSLDEKSTVTTSCREISVPFTPLDSVGDQGLYSVKGMVTLEKDPRPFTSRNGNRSWVKNIVIGDGKNTLNVVLWGENALLETRNDCPIEIFHGTAKPGRYGDIELHAGKDSFVRNPGNTTGEIIFTGTVVAEQGELFLDNGSVRYLLKGQDLPFGQEVTVTGTVSGARIMPCHWELSQILISELQQKIWDLRRQIEDIRQRSA